MLYMAVTADKYELPCFVADSGRELSKIVGISEPYFWDLLHKSKPYKKTGNVVFENRGVRRCFENRF